MVVTIIKTKIMPKGTFKNQVNSIKEAANNDFSYPNDIDAQRIKDAFFSAPIKPEPKTEAALQLKPISLKKNKHFSWMTLTFIAAICLFLANSLSSNYEVLILNRNHIPLTKNQISLFSNSAISEITLLAKDSSQAIKPKAFTIASGVNEAQINFNRPVNLREDSLSFLINKPDGAADMKIVLRDDKLFSNSLSPITSHISQNSSSLIKSDLDLSNISNPYVNPAKITQLRIYFQTADKNNPIKILIKDLILTQKGLKD